MEKKQLQEIKKEFEKQISIRNELLKHLKFKTTEELIEVMSRNEIPQDEDIMLEILEKENIDSTGIFYVNKGLFFIKEMYSMFERSWFIKESNQEELKKLIKDRTIINGNISRVGYNLETGKKVYEFPTNSVVITLPSVIEKENNLEKFDYVNRNLEKEEGIINIKALQAQYFIKLIKSYEDAQEYYSDEKNYKKIEDDMNKYLSEKQKNKRLIKKNNSFYDFKKKQ